VSLTASALKLLADKGLSAQDIAELASLMEADKPRSKGAERQARYRQRKQNNVTNDVTRDVTPAPNEYILTPTPEKPEPIGSVKKSIVEENRRAVSSCLHKAFKVEVPEWVPESYAEFRAMRKAMRNVPFGESADRRCIAKLEQLRAEGHDPEKLLSKAIENGHRTFYPDDSTRATRAGAKVERTPAELRDMATKYDQLGMRDDAAECRRKAALREQAQAA
jgi:hypothetical protein